MATNFIQHVQTGVHGDRPGASTVPQGTLYACTTHGLIYQSDGSSTWATWFGTSAVSSFGSNVNAVSTANAPGASSSNTRSDHVHLGVTSVSHASNTFSGPITLTASGVLGITSPTSGTFNLSAVDTAGGSGSSGVTVQDEGTPLSTTATTLNFVGAGVAATGSGATKTITIAGGSGAALLPLDVAPGSPSSWDDEFDGGSLDVKWSQITSASGNDAAAAVANGWLTFELNTSGTGNASKRVTGYRQTAPTSGQMTNFEVSAKIADSQWNDDARDGVWVANETDNLAHVLGTNWPNGGAGVAMGISSYSESADWGGFSGYQTAAPAPNSGRSILWVAIRWIDATTTLEFRISEDGVLWSPVATRTSMIRPTKIGLALWSNSNTLDKAHQLAADWFRVRSI